MASFTNDGARLLAMAADEDGLEQKDMPSSFELTRPSVLHRRWFKAALAGALSVAVVLGVFSALPSARGASTTEVTAHKESLEAPQSLFDNVKYCPSCECACEAYASSCNQPASRSAGQCCRDCCCEVQLLAPPPPTESGPGTFQKLNNWYKGVDMNYTMSSWLGPLLCILIGGVGMYFFLNAVFPTPASGISPPPPTTMEKCGSCLGRS
mmetsp:Transcript_144005/g.460894  ORF Transcript_144005/g.460894 Transcript_144005/m.460894 type:complete len:210 (-) Transcript_144005:194-823(-)